MWSLKVNKRNIKVYTKPHEQSAYHWYRAETESQLPMSYFVHLFKDVPNYKSWMHTTIKSECVEDVSETEKVIYMRNHNFPIKDRDYYARISFEQNPETLQTCATWKLDDNFGTTPDAVRLKKLQLNLTMTPTTDRKKMRIEFTGHFEPGGKVPDWLANAFITDVPYKTLLNAQKKVKQKKYQAPVAFIQDYRPI